MIEAGVFLIDKPVGPSSFKMVQMVRRSLGIKKVGHTGTLDPFASGLLIICAGRPATKIISQLMVGHKCYEAQLKLGVETDTFDLEGKVTATADVPVISAEELATCLKGFTGEQLQAPPQFSALKHKGKPLYFYARQGIKVEKEARQIVIHELQCNKHDGDELVLQVSCGKGTYIRSLAADIGVKLGCGAHLIGLRRLQNGPFSVENAISIENFNGDRQDIRQVLLDRALTVEATLKIVKKYKESSYQQG